MMDYSDDPLGPDEAEDERDAEAVVPSVWVLVTAIEAGRDALKTLYNEDNRNAQEKITILSSLAEGLAATARAIEDIE